MKTDFYISPAAETFQVKVEDVICGTGQVKFSGQKGSAGYIDNTQNIDGGDF